LPTATASLYVLRTLPRPPRSTLFPYTTLFRSLVEGDASLLMVQYMTRSPARQLAFMKSMVVGGAGSTEEIERAPRVLRETLLFPYFQGMSWTAQLYRRGGWDEVSAAFTKLPKSTKQILHAEKYFAGEEPLKVSIRD